MEQVVKIKKNEHEQDDDPDDTNLDQAESRRSGRENAEIPHSEKVITTSHATLLHCEQHWRSSWVYCLCEGPTWIERYLLIRPQVVVQRTPWFVAQLHSVALAWQFVGMKTERCCRRTAQCCSNWTIPIAVVANTAVTSLSTPWTAKLWCYDPGSFHHLWSRMQSVAWPC